MLIPLILLTALSLMVMVTGAVWTVALSGQVQTRTGADVGAEIVAKRMVCDVEQETVVAQRTTFSGKAVSAGGEVEASFEELKALLGEGNWSAAFPILLTIAGLCGLLLFGALTLLVGLENRLVGWMAVGVALYAVTRTLVGLARA